jgi:multimeric flavodoxin WrbA
MLGLGLPINKYFPSLYPLFQKIGKKLKTNINKGGKKMKIVAFIGSPHKRISNTRELLRWVLEEAESLGAETKIIDILDHKINYCSGCGTCLMNGTCPQTDDMRNLKEIMKESDGIILASPVYFFSVPAQMKTFIDRLLSFGHRPSLSGKYGLSVVVSAGKGEIQVANWLLSILQSFGVNPVGTLSGICITAKNFYDKTALIAQAKHIAQDLVRAWKEKQTFPRNEWNLEFHRFMKELIFYNQEFMRKDFEYWNSHGWFLPEKSLSNINYTDWQKDMKELNQNKSGPASLKKDNLAKCNLKPTRNIPEDITASALIQGMAKAYYPKTLPEKKVIIQFVFPDQNQTHYLEIEGKNCLYYEGEYTAPDLTIITPLKVWADISRGKLSGEQAYLKGKYKCHGDMKYLFKLNEWFEK